MKVMGVTEVLSVSRSASGQEHGKLRELLRKDLFEVAEPEGTDAASSAWASPRRAREGAPKRLLESKDLLALGAAQR